MGSSVASLCASCWPHVSVSSVSRLGPWDLLRRRMNRNVIAEATANSPRQLPTATPAIVPELRATAGLGEGRYDTLGDEGSAVVVEIGEKEVKSVVSTSGVVMKLEVEAGAIVDVGLGAGAPGGLNSVLLLAFDTSTLLQRISKAGAERMVPS
ncbi:hypothetical protein HDV57DRAFT_488931 [Trichoderma longibrachiatum]